MAVVNLWSVIFIYHQILLTFVLSHTFHWINFPGDTPKSKSFEDQLQESTNSDDFFYIFTGDTQYWHQCTLENDGCHREVTCSMDGNQNEVDACTKRMAEYCNRVQKASILGLKHLLNDRIERDPAAVVINGDLTEYGHDDEYSRYKEKWSDWTELKIYPGLGNHDYANNVNDCTFNHCVNRMLRYLKNYVSQTLQLPIDVRGGKKNFIQEQYTGSFAYSWNECRGAGNCVHFIQLNNYPTYTRNIDNPFVEWKILKSINFLKTDLRANAGRAVVLNFHDFDTAFTDSDKREFRDVLETYGRNVTILAVFFAHFHDRIGIRDYWCVNGRRVPLMYTGSIPGNNYMLVKFDPTVGSVKTLYAIHAEGDEQSTVDELVLKTSTC